MYQDLLFLSDIIQFLDSVSVCFDSGAEEGSDDESKSAQSSWYGIFLGQFIQPYDSGAVSPDVFSIQVVGHM